ncbi:MAG: methanol dehydrogenase [Sphingopyxis sp.]|nr:methanol dehydrogenase [Sphingopyxis sp.]
MRQAALVAPLAILLIAGGCKQAPEAVAAQEPAACTGVPPMALAGYVTDAAGILTGAEETRLTERLARYEQRTKHQIVVATTPALNGIDVGTFGDCLGNRWGTGDKDRNDGILILVAPTDRRARISTGTGMEAMLTNEEAKDVINQMTSHFKSLDYAGGLSTGIDAIAVQTGEAR